MSDPVVRVAIALAVIVVAVVVAVIAKSVRKPIHPTVFVGDLGDRPGVVLFTSTDCSSCKKAIARLKEMSVPYREVTHELEPQQFEAWEVVAVPLTVVLDADGEAVEVISGVPPKRLMRNAMKTAGMSAT